MNNSDLTVRKNPYVINESDVQQVREWLATRGGFMVWRSANGSWLTPARNEDGTPTTQSNGVPERVITNADEVVVRTPIEWQRIRVATRRGSTGRVIKVTEAGTRRIRKEVQKWPGAFYEFDYGTCEVVIYRPMWLRPLTSWGLN